MCWGCRSTRTIRTATRNEPGSTTEIETRTSRTHSAALLCPAPHLCATSKWCCGRWHTLHWVPLEHPLHTSSKNPAATHGAPATLRAVQLKAQTKLPHVRPDQSKTLLNVESCKEKLATPLRLPSLTLHNSLISISSSDFFLYLDERIVIIIMSGLYGRLAFSDLSWPPFLHCFLTHANLETLRPF